MHRWLLAVFVALTMVLTTCGGGDDDTSTGKDSKSHDNDDAERSSGSDAGDQAPAGGDKGGDAATTEGSGDGGTSGGSSRDDYLAAVSDMAGEGGDATEVSCLTGAYIDAVGVDRINAVTSPEKIEQDGLPSFVDLGIELTDAERDRFYDSISGCIDVRQYFLGSFGDPAVTDCLNRKVDDGMLKRYVLAIFTQEAADQSDPTIAGLQTTLTECQGSG